MKYIIAFGFLVLSAGCFYYGAKLDVPLTAMLYNTTGSALAALAVHVSYQ